MKRKHPGEGDKNSHAEDHPNVKRVGNQDKGHSADIKGTFSLKTELFQQKNEQFPYYRQPHEIGYFSLNLKREFLDDVSKLKFYVPPRDKRGVNYNLRHGYKDMISKDDSIKEYIHDLLRWVLAHREAFILRDGSHEANIYSLKSLNTDFICWRGLLTRLLCTPFESRDGWLIAVTLFNGTYYLCEFDTEQKKEEKARMTERQDEMCYWGWKFEQYLVTDSPAGTPDPGVPVNNCEAYCTVVRSRLKTHSVVFAGEVDCVDPRLSTPCKYVELKTSREIDNPRQEENFKRFKLIKWWAQSFLPGVPKIVCGFRDDDGVVHRLQSYNTLQIPNLVKDIRNPWDASVCFNFLDKFLNFVKRTVKVDNCRTVHLFSWRPSEDIVCRDMGTESEFQFLPDWYLDKVFNQT